MKIERLLIGTAAALLCASAQAQTWDADANWSPPANPNGNWSYGQLSSLGVFTALGWDGFNTEYDVSNTPGLGAQVWENGLSYATYGIAPGDISLDSGYGTSVVRFTAPTTGDYLINIAIGGTLIPENGGEGNALAGYGNVAVDGTIVARNSFIGNVAQWSFTTPLATGDTVDAYVGSISVPAAANTALTFTVNSTPEPSGYLVFGLGAIGLFVNRKRKSRTN
jgi:hypothetical protein